MSVRRRDRYARLLRWYPRSWRDEHGSIMLDTLDQHASDRGAGRPSVPEAWSLRAHGLGERATSRWAAGSAAIALLAFVGAAALLLSDAMILPGIGFARLVLAVFIGPLAVTLSGVILLLRSGRLSAPAALMTAVSAVPACGFAAMATASWFVGFEEADAGVGGSWFGSSTLFFLILGWVAGTMCLLAPVDSVLRTPRTRLIRLAQNVILAAPLTLVLGALMLMSQLIGALGAVVLLVVALRSGGRTYQSARRETAPVAMGSSRSIAAVWTRRRAAPAGAAALVTVIVGLGCAFFALTGSAWVSTVNDSTHAMNLGLAAGAVAAIPATIAAGIVLTPRFGGVMRWSSGLGCASLIVEAAAQFLGAGHPNQWPLTLVAAVTMGFAIALPFGRLIPGGRVLHISVTTMFGFVGSIIGLSLVTMAGFIAPPAAIALFIWSVTRSSAHRTQPGPPLMT